MDYKDANKDVYDKNAKTFEDRTSDYLRDHILFDAELFLASLPGHTILDLGSGPGRDSKFFHDRGLRPLCLDISPEMVKLCREKGLEAMVGDLENLDFQEASFDGVWAYTSLLHMPKRNLPLVLSQVKRVLKPKGVFYIGMKEGDHEGWLESEKYGGVKRFFSLYSDEELRKYLHEHFSILHSSRVPLGDAVFLNYLCRRD